MLLIVTNLAGCTESAPKTVQFELVMKKTFPPRNSSVALTLINKDTQENFSLAPASVDQFDCFVMNVMGPSIPSVNSSDPSDAWGRYKSDVIGGSSSGYIGIVSNFVPTTGGTLTARVPIGTDRFIQILGVRSNLGCTGTPQGLDLYETSNYPALYEIGRAPGQEALKDISITIQSTYSSSTNSDIRKPIVSPPAAFTYSSTSISATTGVAISSLSPTSTGGKIVAYSVSPSLPSGLSINSKTGVISGTPTAVSSSATYTITGENPGGAATFSLTISVTSADSISPTPGNSGTITATANATSVSLSWTTATDNITPVGSLQYKVVRASNTSSINTITLADAATTVVDWTANISSTTATGLNSSTSYAFAVLVRDAAQNKALYTPVASTTTSSDSTAPTVGNSGTITATPSSTSVALSWTAATDNVTAQSSLQYKVVRSTSTSLINTVANADAATVVLDWTANVTNTTASSLTASTTYAFAVLVRDAALNKSLYTPVSATTNSADITPPVNGGLISRAAGSTSIGLSWPQASDNVTAVSSLQYKVVTGVSTGAIDTISEVESSTIVQDWTANLTSVSVSSLNPATVYFYNVIVKDEAGNKTVYTPVSVITGILGSAERVVSIGALPSGETALDLAAQSGEMNGAFLGSNFYQFYKAGSGQTYLLKMSNTGLIDMSFGTKGWLKLSTVTGAPTITGNNIYWTWKACNGTLYFLKGDATNGVWTLYPMDFSGSSPAFLSSVGSLTAYTSGAATIQSFQCYQNVLYATFDTNSAPATLYFLKYDTTTSTFTSNSYSNSNTIMAPFIDGSTNLRAYELGSTNKFWTFDSSLAQTSTVNVNSGNPGLEDGVQNSSTDLTFYARFGTHIKIYSDTPNNLVSSFTSGTMTPTIDYTVGFTTSSVTRVRMCKVNNKYAIFAQSFSGGKELFTILNSDGSRYSGFNGGDEFSFAYTSGSSTYDGNAGRFYLNVNCDLTNNLVAYTYKTSTGTPTVILVDTTVTDNGPLTKKILYVAPQSTVQGVQKQGNITIAGADNLCQTDSNKPNSSTYKALMVAGSSRRACSTANCSAGASENIDWPLQANTTYTRPDGTIIGTTNARGILMSIKNTIFPSFSYAIYTGLNTDWTTSSNTCSGWTNNVSGSGAYGTSNGSTVNSLISISTTTCPNYLSFYCAEQ